MKKIFKLKKGKICDADEGIINYLIDKLLEDDEKSGGYPIYKKNWKVTILIEEAK